MSSCRSRLFARVAALVALLLFAGFLVADQSFNLSKDHCSEMTSGCGEPHSDTCHHCFCSFHGGMVIALEPFRLSGPVVSEERSVLDWDQNAPRGERAPIHRPPRLA